jgi:hypothetical protein
MNSLEGMGMEKVLIEVEELPELDTVVGISGSTRQNEVAGPACFGIIAGIMIYSNG